MNMNDHYYNRYVRQPTFEYVNAAGHYQRGGEAVVTDKEPDVLDSLLDEEARKGIESIAFNLAQLLDRQGIHAGAIDAITRDVLHWETKALNLPNSSYDPQFVGETSKQRTEIEKQIQELRRERRRLETDRWKDALSLALALPALLSEARTAEGKKKVLTADW